MFSFLLPFLLACQMDSTLLSITPEVPQPQLYEETFIQEVPTPYLDILVVVDTSGSMTDDQHRVARGLARTIWNLRDAEVDWRVTYAAAAHAEIVEGPLTLSDNATDLDVIDLVMRVIALPQWNGFEAGFAGAMSSEPVTDPERDLLLFVLSDEDDQSYWPDNTHIQPDEWAAWAKGLRPEGEVDVISVVKLEGCYGEPGTKYIEAMEIGGWDTLNICTEWEPELPTSSWLINIQMTWELKFEPVRPSSVKVWVDEVRNVEWELDDKLITFTRPPPDGAKIRVQYEAWVGNE